MISCFICHGHGHMAANCIVRGDGRHDKHNGCYICGSNEHLKGFHADFKHNEAKCSNCNEYGHDLRFCLRHRRGRKRGPRPGRGVSKLNFVTNAADVREEKPVEEKEPVEEQGAREDAGVNETTSNNLDDNGTDGNSVNTIAANDLYEDQATQDAAQAESDLLAQHGRTHKFDPHSQQDMARAGAHFRSLLRGGEDGSRFDDFFNPRPSLVSKESSMSSRAGTPQDPSIDTFPDQIGTSKDRALDRFDQACKKGRTGLEELLQDEEISGVEYPSLVPEMKGIILAKLAKFPPIPPPGMGTCFHANLNDYVLYVKKEERRPLHETPMSEELKACCADITRILISNAMANEERKRSR